MEHPEGPLSPPLCQVPQDAIRALLTGQSWFNGKQGEGAAAGVFHTLAQHIGERVCLCERASMSKNSLVCLLRSSSDSVKYDSLHSHTSTPSFQSSKAQKPQLQESILPPLPPTLPPTLSRTLPVSVSLVAGEVAYLCSCQSAASSSAGAPASPALLSPSPAWLSWSSPPSPSSCGSPSLLPDEAHTFTQAEINQNPAHGATTF